MSGGDGFLSRWSRRKQAAADEPDELETATGDVAADAADEAEEGALREAEPAEELSEAEILEKYDLKDPDELASGDDFSGFMRSAIPEHLRRRALRTLWRTNPVLANLDGLNDYDGDWTGGSVPRGELKTAYRVGLGFVREVAEAAAKFESAADSPAEDGETELAEATRPIPEPEAPDVENDDEDDEDRGEVIENTGHSARRRMVFRVGEG